MEAQTFTGLLVFTTNKSAYIDFGGKVQKRVWVAHKLIIERRTNKDYPELTDFNLPTWFAKKEGLI